MVKDFGGIYAIFNLKTVQVYIGSTMFMKRRKRDHFWSLREKRHVNKKLQHSFDKYGEEFFEFKVLELCDSPSELLYLEQRYIDYYSYNFEIFNLCKVAGSKLGYKATEDTIEKLRKVSKGRNLGRKRSDETKAKMRIVNKNKVPTTQNRKALLLANSKPVGMFDIDGNLIERFYSIAEAARKTGYSKSSIGYYCNGINKPGKKVKVRFGFI